MKKGLCALAFCLCCSTIPAVSMAEKVTLTYSTFFPPTHIQSVTSENWCKEVEKRTEGRVKVQFFPGQTLTRAPQTYEAVTDGIADIGVAALAYTQGRFPVMSSMDLPLGYPSGKVATKIANDLYEKMKPAEFDATAIMYFHAHGPGYIHTKKKAVEKLEDIKGQRIRSTGMSANTISALGGTPVSMAMPDTYQSLQRGVVDGSFHPIETNKGWNIGEVVSYLTIAQPAAYTTVFYVAMNKNKWNALDSEDQKIITQINAEWAAKHGDAWDSSDSEGMTFFQQKGGKVINLDATESARWAEVTTQVVEAYSKQLDGLGFKGVEVFDFIRASIADQGTK